MIHDTPEIPKPAGTLLNWTWCLYSQYRWSKLWAGVTELGRQECGREKVQVSMCVVSLRLITKVRVSRGGRLDGTPVSLITGPQSRNNPLHV